MRLFPFLPAFQTKKDAPPPQKGAVSAKPATSVFSGPVADTIAAIEKSGGSFRPILRNDDRREVSFYLRGPAIKDADIAPVAQLPKVASLRLDSTSITDAGLAYIKGLTDLEQLHLENTRITDKGLVNLAGLKKLTYLNLYNTAVTDACLAQLTGLVNLKELFLWQTKVTDEGVKKLRQVLPNLNIDRGLALEAKPPAKPEPKEEKKQKPN